MSERLLAVDTATEICGVAMMVDGETQQEIAIRRGTTHTRHVMGAVDEVLRACRLTPAQIDAFAVTRGPGSFTGLRIGISTVKGLAAAMEKPLVGVSSLAALARQADGDTPLICSLLDARRHEVYWCIYRREPREIQPVVEERVGRAEGIVPYIDDRCQFIGNGIRVSRDLLEPLLRGRACWTAGDRNDLRPSVVARMGWETLRNGGPSEGDTFAPVYLRKSDAELNRRPAS